MDKLYSVLLHENGVDVVEFPVVKETSGTYHIITASGKRVIKKIDIGKFEYIGNATVRCLCEFKDVQANIELAKEKSIQNLNDKIQTLTNLKLEIEASSKDIPRFATVDQSGEDTALKFMDVFGK